MAVPDSKGNTFEQVRVEYDGYVAINFNALAPPAELELRAASLPEGYAYLGLLESGYDEDVETGDNVPMWVPDYEIQSGEFGVGGKIVAAESNDTVNTLLGHSISGVGDNAVHSRTTTHSLEAFGLITATVDQYGKATIRGGMAQVTGVAPSYGARGEIDTVEISFKWLHVNNTYYTEVVRDMWCIAT